MELSVRRKNVYFGFSEVVVNVLIFWVDDDFREPHWVFFGLVDPGVERRDIGVVNLFSLGFVSYMMELDSNGFTAEKGISGFERIY